MLWLRTAAAKKGSYVSKCFGGIVVGAENSRWSDAERGIEHVKSSPIHGAFQ